MTLNRFAVAAAIMLATITPGQLQAEEKAPASTIEFPKEFKGLSSELSKLLQKYPGASERFHILDTKAQSEATPTSAHHMCCEYSCPGDDHSSPECQCISQCKE